LFEAVAAAGFDVPVEAFLASLDHAAAFAVLSVFVSEPVFTSCALRGGAFTSASVSVPVLAIDAILRWAAEALTAFMVPEVVGSTVAWVSADALAEMFIKNSSAPQLPVSKHMQSQLFSLQKKPSGQVSGLQRQRQSLLSNISSLPQT